MVVVQRTDGKHKVMIGVIVIQVKNVEMQMNSKKEELRGSGNCMMGE